MRVLFTGSSSFTGYHFLDQINKKKIKTFAIFSKQRSYYKKNYQKKILSSKLKFVKPKLNTKFGSNKFLKIIKEEKIDTICFHHFIVGNLDQKYKFNQNLKKLLLNLDSVVYYLAQNSNPCIIYTSSVYQRISTNSSYLNDNSRINYGLTKLILFQILKYHCNKNKIKLIDFELQNPIGQFEKENSLPYYIAKSYFDRSETILNHPKRIFKYEFIDKISKDYVKVLNNKKRCKSKYKKNSVLEFRKILFTNFNKVEKRKVNNTFWKKYYNYYKELNAVN